uniref:Transmembrane protein n=1 Tax=Steinernema glaseri TaxID=37863 RepID=A0A1I7Y1L6_9BILA
MAFTIGKHNIQWFSYPRDRLCFIPRRSCDLQEKCIDHDTSDRNQQEACVAHSQNSSSALHKRARPQISQSKPKMKLFVLLFFVSAFLAHVALSSSSLVPDPAEEQDACAESLEPTNCRSKILQRASARAGRLEKQAPHAL